MYNSMYSNMYNIPNISTAVHIYSLACRLVIISALASSVLCRFISGGLECYIRKAYTNAVRFILSPDTFY